MNLTSAQFTGIVRAILSGVGGVLASLGWMSDASWQTISGAAIVVLTAVWSVLSKKTA